MELNGEPMEVETQQRRRWNNVGERVRSGGRKKVKAKTRDWVKAGITTSIRSS